MVNFTAVRDGTHTIKKEEHNLILRVLRHYWQPELPVALNLNVQIGIVRVSRDLLG